ncbi:STAS/SEC14 domain-containing protein [Lysobacter sp. MMG2]|uniref:STAS/SEC14 domain-containing protein n=1 Tax=Lysobacter sp. MMG2 TaxID=2801338 RepID=UPI001C230B20|nr:STAS/SEC14 domain-containing protein [Lysobacter sp. MMG2]MBU8978224.1 STAS/SEC14 domain-containing protein [Lysobacter sp. MMG2]
MIDLLPSPSHVGAYRFSGTLDGADYDRCIADLESRLRLHERIGIYCDMTGFTGITPEAMAKDLRYSLSKFGEYRRFARGAIVTDKEWLARISEFAGHFFPNTEIRAFEPAEHDAALEWAAQVVPLGTR